MSKKLGIASFVVSVLAVVAGCSGSSGNGDLTGGQSQAGTGLGGGALGGGALGGSSSGGKDAGAGGLGGSSSGGTSGTGASSSPSGGAGSQQCTLSTGKPTCDTCVNGGCCAQLQACAANAACVEMDSCFSTCTAGDKDCYSTCANENASGAPAMKVFLDCVQSKCTTACQ